MRKISFKRIVPPIERKAIKLLQSPDFFDEIRSARTRQGITTGIGSAILRYLSEGATILDEPPQRGGPDSAIWHEAHRLLTSRLDWMLLLDRWPDTMRGKLPQNSRAARRFPVLMDTMKMSAVIRSFRNPAIGGNPRRPCFIFVDFIDYAVAAALLNDEFADALRGKRISGAGDAGKITRARSGGSNERLLQSDLSGQFFPSPQFLVDNTSWVKGPLEFVHPITGEMVTIAPRKKSA